MRLRRALATAAAGLALGAAPAMAHVDVLPAQVAQGEGLEFTIRVPNEREVPTTRVSIEFPPQITVYSFAAPPPGWTMRTLLTPDKKFRGVVYTGSLPRNGYADFRMLGTPFESGAAVWKTRQTYADGQTKPWTGPPEKPGQEAPETGPADVGPAPVVTVAEPGQAVAADGTTTTAATTKDDSGAAIWLGVIAIAISALCLLALGFLWSTRPAKLPGGGEEA